jgi:hypothetical protein
MTMVTWLVDYWWILASLLYVLAMVIVAVVLSGRGTFERTWPKITLATTCLLVLVIPAMDSPGSYVNAVVVVFNLLVLFKAQRRPAVLPPVAGHESARHARSR